MPVANDPVRAAEPQLPRPPTPFIGRKRLLTVLRDLFASGERLVTVTGTSGIGKTRLALEAARTRASAFSGGAVFCDLTEHSDAESASAALAAQLGVRDADELITVLRRRGEVLVVLDNFEQLVHASAETVGRWLEACPEATFLVTSRELLRLEGEVVVEIPPLALPDHGEDTAAEAVQLWIDRRRRLDPDWLLGPDEAEAVAAIVQQLDGIPLAIELAAARASLLGPRELLARLERRFDVLRHGPRGVHARHATLVAAIDWSWQLLEPWEQSALAQSSVFRGGFDVEAAENVVDLSDHREAPPVLDVLQALRDKSLLRSLGAEPAPTPRLGPFLSIRDFAAERLEEMGAEQETAARHRRYYVELSRRLVEALNGQRGARALDRLAAERDNLGAVIAHGARDEADPASIEQGLVALLAIDELRWTRGPVGAHLEALDRALALAERCEDEIAPAVLTRALSARSMTRVRIGRLAEGDADSERAVRRAERVDDARVRIDAWLDRAWVHWRHRRIDRMAEVLARAGELAAETKDRRAQGMIEGALGAAAKESGDFAGADERYQRALDIHREVGNQRYEGQVLTRRAVMLLEQGRIDEAREAAEAAREIHRRFGDRYVEGLVLTILGASCHAEEHLEEARRIYEEAIPLQRDMGEQRLYGASLGYLGLAAFEAGDVERAVDSLEQARRALEEAAETRHAALFAAFLAGVEAALGHTERAERRLEAADDLGAQHPDKLVDTVIELQRGHLDLARARDATSEGAEGELLGRARARLAVATRPDADGRAPAATSVDVRIAARLLERELDAFDRAEEASDDALLVHPFGHWFRPPGGEPVDCRRRQALRRLLVRLAHQRLHRPGVPLTAEALVDSGWPNEKMTTDSAQNRLYVTLNRLRDLGMRGYLQATGEGYQLDPTCPTRFVSVSDEPE